MEVDVARDSKSQLIDHAFCKVLGLLEDAIASAHVCASAPLAVPPTSPPARG